MDLNNKTLGGFAEDLAAEFLSKQGFIILERNFQSPLGEIDIIALEPKNPLQFIFSKKIFSSSKIIFVEVKAQKQNEFGQAEERIGFFKQEKLKRIALFYLKEKKLINHSFRIDAVRVDLQKQEPKIKHIISAVEEK